MSAEAPIFQLIDFYLSPAFPKKSIELLKLKLVHKTTKIKDPLLKEVTLIRESLQILLKRRKAILHAVHQDKDANRKVQTLFDLSPKDFLILSTIHHFPIKTESLALAISLPVDSIEFRRRQLEEQMNEEGIEIDKLREWKSRELIAPIQKKHLTLKDLLIRLQTMPLALRFTLETIGILATLLGVLWVIPEIRNHYENSIQKRINEYLIENSLIDSPAPEGTSKTPAVPPPSAEAAVEQEQVVEKSSSNDISPRKQPKVNDGEIWRFSFTGSSTPEIESGVIDALAKLGVPTQKPLTVPGGIQFDFPLSVEQVIPLKTALEQKVADIQQKAASSKVNLMSTANMSWYKKKNNQGLRKIPVGHIQVIIWISTL